MKKLIVIAEREELKLVDMMGYSDTPVIITGVGALNVINALKDIPKDTEIINIGYAGSKDLTPGRFYSVESVSLYHPNVSYSEPTYPIGYRPVHQNEECEEDANYEYTVKCLSSADFVTESDMTSCLFDMELAYIKALGFEKVVSYKYVSDNLDLQEYREKLNEE